MTIDGWIHVPARTAAAGGLYNAQTQISNSRFRSRRDADRHAAAAATVRRAYGTRPQRPATRHEKRRRGDPGAFRVFHASNDE